eukprot:gene10906-8445_t
MTSAPRRRPSPRAAMRRTRAPADAAGTAAAALIAAAAAPRPAAASDSSCRHCDTFIFQTGNCQPAQDNLYAIAECDLVDNQLVQKLWTTPDCTPRATPFSTTRVALDVCLQSIDVGEWFENSCPAAAAARLRAGDRPHR